MSNQKNNNYNFLDKIITDEEIDSLSEYEHIDDIAPYKEIFKRIKKKKKSTMMNHRKLS